MSDELPITPTEAPPTLEDQVKEIQDYLSRVNTGLLGEEWVK